MPLLKTVRQLRDATAEDPVALDGPQRVRVGVKAQVLAEVETSALRQVDVSVIRSPDWLPPGHSAADELRALVEREAEALAKLDALPRERENDAARRVSDPSYRGSPRPDFARLEQERREAAASAEADLVAYADRLLEKLRSEAPEHVARLQAERAQAEAEAAEAERIAAASRERANAIAQAVTWWDGQAPRPRVPVLAWNLAAPAPEPPTMGQVYQDWRDSQRVTEPGGT